MSTLSHRPKHSRGLVFQPLFTERLFPGIPSRGNQAVDSWHPFVYVIADHEEGGEH